MDYVLGGRPEGCVFCAALEMGDDEKALVLHRGEHAFVVLNRYPYNTGHLMICPNRHLVGPDEMNDDENLEVMHLLSKCTNLLQNAVKAEGVNAGLNLGRASGGSVDHLHMHLVPRWTGDTNFLPVIGGTKTLVEMLDGTYSRLREGMESW